MLTMKARIVTELDARHRFILSPPTAPASDGEESLDIVCGACGTVLIDSAHPYLAFRNLVIRCPKCKQCNDTEA